MDAARTAPQNRYAEFRLIDRHLRTTRVIIFSEDVSLQQ
jgi:hypothetical protein